VIEKRELSSYHLFNKTAGDLPAPLYVTVLYIYPLLVFLTFASFERQKAACLWIVKVSREE
jgi:hypothetical protein